MTHSFLRFEEINSTNDYLLENYDSLEDGTVVIAFSQLSGKGRRGRSWLSSEGMLPFSILLKGDKYEKARSVLSLIAAASLIAALAKKGIDAYLKWPNDVYLNNKKCAGILLEGVYKEKQEAIVIGIGINVNQTSFPSSLPLATSLRMETKKEFDLDEITESFLKEFDETLEDYLAGGEKYLTIARKKDYLYGKTITLNYYGENITGVAAGIAKDGSLSLKKDDGETITITSGEASLHQD